MSKIWLERQRSQRVGHVLDATEEMKLSACCSLHAFGDAMTQYASSSAHALYISFTDQQQ